MRILELHAPYFAARWRRDHDVVTWGPHPECDLRTDGRPVGLADVLARLPAGWAPDVVLLGDDSNPLLVTGLEDAPCPVAMLAVDAHHHTVWQAPLAGACDVVFVSQRDYLPAFWAAGAVDAQWLPLWAPDDLPPPATPRHDVAFVGSLDPRLHPERATFFAALGARVPLQLAEGPYADVFTRARIVVNQTVRGDLNARVFEAMACGAFLVTERTGNGLLDLFADGQELVTYARGAVDDAAAAVRHWLAAPRERALVAERGRARVRAAHLESHRAAEVLARLSAPLARRADAASRRAVARAYVSLVHVARRLADVLPGDPRPGALRQIYLEAALALASDGRLDDSDRCAVLGTIALERGEVPRALAHFARAVEEGGRPEDHLARIEALVRTGDLRAARDAAAALVDTHPGYDLGRKWAEALGVLASAAEACA